MEYIDLTVSMTAAAAGYNLGDFIGYAAPVTFMYIKDSLVKFEMLKPEEMTPDTTAVPNPKYAFIECT